MNFPRSLLLILCALALQGCITYYYPAYAPAEGEYYAGDPQYAEEEYYEYEGETYDLGTPVVDLRVANAAYYPWRSLDYYYLGPHYYRPPYLGYTSGWYSSLGYLHRYPPYYSPYGIYGPLYYPSPFLNVYEPWYSPWYGWPGYVNSPRFIWYDNYWNGHYQANAQQDAPNAAYQQAYGVSRNAARVARVDDGFGDPRDRASYQPRQAQNSEVAARRVWTPSSSQDGDQAMEVRSRQTRKIENAHIGPAPVISSISSPRPAASAPVVRQATPPRAQPTPVPAQSRPVASTPRVVRQGQARQAMTPSPRASAPSPGVGPARSATPVPPPANPPTPYDKSGNRRHKQ